MTIARTPLLALLLALGLVFAGCSSDEGSSTDNAATQKADDDDEGEVSTGDSCTPSGSDSQCGSVGYCDEETNECVKCTGAARNCDRDDETQCECSGGCDGQACFVPDVSTCDHDEEDACHSDQLFCQADDTCAGCEDGRFNCNGDSEDKCECPRGCNGDKCKGETINCYEKFCDKETEVCAVYVDSTENYHCKPIPDDCRDDLTCECRGVREKVCSHHFSDCGESTLQEQTFYCGE